MGRKSVNYFSHVFNTIEHHPLDYNPSIAFQCKPDYELVTTNPVIELGCIVAVKTSTGSIFGYKIGDGKTPYNSLPYFDTNFSAQTPLEVQIEEAESTQIIDGGTSHV